MGGSLEHPREQRAHVALKEAVVSETTYVLIHGAWGGEWCWRDVGSELTRRGAIWTALDLPSSTLGAHPTTYLADDAREVSEIARLEGPVVLVGHSYGGAVITEAAPDIPNLERLIYVAALVPELGQSASELARSGPRTLLDEAIEVHGDVLGINRELAAKALYHDCPDDVAQWATSQLSTQTIASFRSPRGAYDVDVPSYYIKCTNDRAIDPELQELMSARCNEVATLESGHTPLLSQPHTLCDLVLSSATS
jgi:pimeloyl-ACP methyl ester carboxylesterase